MPCGRGTRVGILDAGERVSRSSLARGIPARPALRAGVLASILGTLGAAGCFPDRAGRGHPPDGRSEAPPLDLAGDLPLPPPYGADPLWTSAVQGDDFALARLGRQESAEVLLDALQLGGSAGRTALGALPYARDRRSVLGRSCELATHATPATTSLLLGSILEIVENAPRTEETVDTTGSAACVASLRQLSERQDQNPADHDRAQSALSRLESRTALVSRSR
jgi:hypothetical protein